MAILVVFLRNKKLLLASISFIVAISFITLENIKLFKHGDKHGPQKLSWSQNDLYKVLSGNAKRVVKDDRESLTDNAYNDDGTSQDKSRRDLGDLLSEAVVSLRNFPPQPFIVGGPIPAFNKSCANFSTLYDMEFDNNWQMMYATNGTAYIYGAYYDNRYLTWTSNITRGPAVRILGMMDWTLRSNRSTFYCQLWFNEENEPVFSKVTDQGLFWKYVKGRAHLFLFTCPILGSYQDKVPVSVSIVEHPCDKATNNVRVLYEYVSEKKDFAVCTKGLDFFHEDHSVRLTEWIELLHILGADKIFLYELSEHPNASKVLRYYEHTDYVDVTPLTIPGGLPNDPRLRHIYFKNKIEDKRTHEMIPYNDCLYRNMYKYKYIALLDPDETIVPLKVLTWKALTTNLETQFPDNFNSFTSICFRNAYFFDAWMENRTFFTNIPKFMHQLQHVYRSRGHTRKILATKCLHNTEKVVILHNHFPAKCFSDCDTFYLNTKDGQLQHYKPSCPKYIAKCKTKFGQRPVIDNNLWRYKNELITRTVGVLQKLGFISNNSADAWISRTPDT